MSYKLSVSSKRYLCQIPPHAYIHASPWTHTSHFNTAMTFRSPWALQHECRKGKTCRLITMPPWRRASVSPRKKKKTKISRKEDCSCCKNNQIKFLPASEMWRSKCADQYWVQQLCLSTAPCHLSNTNISHQLRILWEWCIFFDFTGSQKPTFHAAINNDVDIKWMLLLFSLSMSVMAPATIFQLNIVRT